MLDKIRLKLLGSADIVGNAEIGIINLIDEDEKRMLPIVCDRQTKNLFHKRLTHPEKCKDMLPEVLIDIITNQLGLSYHIIISEIKGGEYFANIVSDDNYEKLPMRAPDAVLYHVISQAPIFVDATLFNTQSVPYVPGSPAMAIPYNILTDKMLIDAMNHAVETENYEMASRFRDELRSRNK